MESKIDQLFIGTVRPLLPEGEATGIYKSPVDGPVALTRLGLAGDEHGDPRHHGGPDKALHQYPAEHYAALAQVWPERGELLRPGVLGENISSHDLTEDTVCIGDIFAIGDSRVQVSQPRSPCWKIDRRLGVADASRFVEAAGVTGWYYRVLVPGTIAPGDSIVLLERPTPELTLARYWAITLAHRPEPAALRAVAAAPGLAQDKAARWLARADWLARNVAEPASR